MARRTVEAGWLGRVEYEDGLRMQEEAEMRLAAAARPGAERERLLLLEHAPVYTLGRNASESDIVAGRGLIEARGARVVRCSRGGKVTFHGPGQVVGYPILDLKPDRRDVGRYVADLEETIIRTLADWGLDGGRFPGYTGVWVDVESPAKRPAMLAGDGRQRTKEGRSAATEPPPPSIRKIAAIGVHLSRWITSHGFALNVTTDLDWYELIVPCGIREFGVTSMAALLGRDVPMAEVAGALERHFRVVFDRDTVPLPVATG